MASKITIKEGAERLPSKKKCSYNMTAIKMQKETRKGNLLELLKLITFV